jgi:PPOX class probable F420-dependent enzyme
MSKDKLTQFANQTYLSLETYRKSGIAVPTPVWFVEDQGILYVRTIANSGKVKRIRNNPQVRVTPCNMRGGLLGEWVDAQARLVDESATEKINRLFKRKYGIQKFFFDLLGGGSKSQSVNIAIEVQ